MDWVQLGFTIVILGVILVFECKVAFGTFLKKSDVPDMQQEMVAAGNEFLLSMSDRIIALESNHENLYHKIDSCQKILNGTSPLKVKDNRSHNLLYDTVEDIRPESHTLQAVESGARIASEAFALGSKAVLDALTRDGRIAGETPAVVNDGAINIGEEDYELPPENPVLADIIIARNQQAAEQMGDKINDDLMKFMDGKI